MQIHAYTCIYIHIPIPDVYFFRVRISQIYTLINCVPEKTVLVCFDVLFTYIFEVVTGGEGMVQLKIGSAKNQTITGSDQHQRTSPLATTLPRQPTLRRPCPRPRPRPRLPQQRPRVLPSRTSLQLRRRPRPAALQERRNRGLVRAAGRSRRAWFRLNQCAWIVVTACKPVTATASPCNSQSLPSQLGKTKSKHKHVIYMYVHSSELYIHLIKCLCLYMSGMSLEQTMMNMHGNEKTSSSF